MTDVLAIILGGGQGKRISLEKGGKNAILVMDDADLGLATDAIAWSAFGSSGQRCTACSRVRIPETPGVENGRMHSLPLRALPAAEGGTGGAFAIVLTGDGPSGGTGKRVAADLAGAQRVANAE